MEDFSVGEVMKSARVVRWGLFGSCWGGDACCWFIWRAVVTAVA